MHVVASNSTIDLAVALEGNSPLTPTLGLVSAAAVIPAAIGMYPGQRVRQALSQARFRQIFFLRIVALGADMLINVAVG